MKWRELWSVPSKEWIISKRTLCSEIYLQTLKNEYFSFFCFLNNQNQNNLASCSFLFLSSLGCIDVLLEGAVYVFVLVLYLWIAVAWHSFYRRQMIFVFLFHLMFGAMVGSFGDEVIGDVALVKGCLWCKSAVRFVALLLLWWIFLVDVVGDWGIVFGLGYVREGIICVGCFEHIKREIIFLKDTLWYIHFSPSKTLKR